MPLTIPRLDNRTYQDLRDEALRRIPVHTPEWTNYNRESDPGVTLIELFAFLTENLLFLGNGIPDRNRRKFLQLLKIPLKPASSAQGIVTFSNERGPLQTHTLAGGLEVTAGQVPFLTELGLDVLPVETQIVFKREVRNPPEELRAYYDQLYASYGKPLISTSARLYETTSFPFPDMKPLNLGADSIDGALWVALLVRAGDWPPSDNPSDQEAVKNRVRDQLSRKTFSLGLVPALVDAGLDLASGDIRQSRAADNVLNYEIPVGGNVPRDTTGNRPRPEYRELEASAVSDVLTVPGLVQIRLPESDEMILWNDLEPLEPGVGDLPPSFEDTALNDRIITWLRIRPSYSAGVNLLWVGINATMVRQRIRVINELLPDGTGLPDQSTVLANRPVIPDSIELTVSFNGDTEDWHPIDDLISAGSEVPVRDPRQPPGVASQPNDQVKVFTVDAEAGRITFGDGLRGARPPAGAALRVNYEYSLGRDGNVNAGSINTGSNLPAGLLVNNPVATWGGAEAETVPDGEKQISRYLQHRERLVTRADFETIIKRTPGVDIGRVEVIPNFNPELAPNSPGDAPGAVTVMVIPKYDTAQPDAPLPDRPFLSAVAAHLNPRRLLTTEVFLRGPVYKDIWISVGITIVPGASIAEVREAVRRRLQRFLSSLPSSEQNRSNSSNERENEEQNGSARTGWMLGRPVIRLEVITEAAREPNVLSITNVLLAEGNVAPSESVDIRGLELPRVRVSVLEGEPTDLSALRGRPTPPPRSAGLPAGVDGPAAGGDAEAAVPQILPVPVTPEEC